MKGKVVDAESYSFAPKDFPPQVEYGTKVEYPWYHPIDMSSEEKHAIQEVVGLVPKLHEEERVIPDVISSRITELLSARGLRVSVGRQFKDVFVELESGVPILVYFDREGRKSLYGLPAGWEAKEAEGERERAKQVEKYKKLFQEEVFKSLEEGRGIVVDDGFLVSLPPEEAEQTKHRIGEILRSGKTAEGKAVDIAKMLSAPIDVGRNIVEGSVSDFFV